jgi:hypothetical protein
VSNKHGDTLGLHCAAATFKNFLIVPLKAAIFGKFTFTIKKKFLSFSPHYRRWWQAADLWEKPVAGRRSQEKTGV